MNDKIKELKDLLFELDSKHSVSVPDTQQNINDVAKKIVKLFAIHSVRKSLETDIYVTYDELDGDVYGAFDSEGRCKIEAEESGCGMKTMKLYKGERT